MKRIFLFAIVCMLLIALLGCGLGRPNAPNDPGEPNEPSDPQPDDNLSKSKISIHLIDRYPDGARKVVQAGPRVLKILHIHESMLEAMREYKNLYPEGIVVLRIYTPVSYDGWSPQDAANHFWNDVLKGPINELSESDRALIDYVEGPNEHDNYPVWNTVETAKWFSDFWLVLAEHIANAGFKPLLASIPVGNPSGNSEEMLAKIEAFVPALRKAKQLGGGWAYHSYTISSDLPKDVNVEVWYSLRYRQFYEYFEQKGYTDLLDLPLILTEAGFDGGSIGHGWRALVGDAEAYIDWLKWYDSELRKDSYVLGATLFQTGAISPDWDTFETEPEINEWLATYLESQK